MTINRTAVFNEVKDYVFITFGLMLYTFGFTVFLLPYKIVTGGIAGIGAIVFYATHFPVQYTFFLINAVLIMVDLCIIGSSLFIPSFGDVFHRCQMVVFGLCTMVIECLMLDYVMSVQRQSVQFLIFSKHYEDIARAITRKTDHSLTLLDGHGWYSGKEMKVICLLAKKRESVTIFRLIKMIDPQAFVSQSSVIGVYGEGFDPIKVKPGKAEKEGHNIKTNEDSIRN